MFRCFIINSYNNEEYIFNSTEYHLEKVLIDYSSLSHSSRRIVCQSQYKIIIERSYRWYFHQLTITQCYSKQIL